MITGSNKSIMKPNEVVSILSMNKAAFSIVKYDPPVTENVFFYPTLIYFISNIFTFRRF